VSPRVLVVEDHKTMRDAVRMILEPEGFVVLEATDGNAALEVIRRDLPEVVLLDFGIPGLDGAEVLARLKADPVTRRVPVIVVTATGLEAKREALALGAAAFFTKPFSPAALLRTMATVLGEPGAAES
jgi:two-component system, OmpR family, alkaline phosphatase synthesis response regulator PhoP